MAGTNFNPMGLFPVTFPVPSGTPIISSLIQWDHSQTWKTPELDEFALGRFAGGGSSSCVFEIDVSDHSDDRYLVGHKIDGRVLFPATGYLVLAWKALAKLSGQAFDTMAVSLENVEILRAVILPPEGTNPTLPLPLIRLPFKLSILQFPYFCSLRWCVFSFLTEIRKLMSGSNK